MNMIKVGDRFYVVRNIASVLKGKLTIEIESNGGSHSWIADNEKQCSEMHEKIIDALRAEHGGGKK